MRNDVETIDKTLRRVNLGVVLLPRSLFLALHLCAFSRARTGTVRRTEPKVPLDTGGKEAFHVILNAGDMTNPVDFPNKAPVYAPKV